jgi:dihydrofolate synthase / folylpolyglutamate synthase
LFCDQPVASGVLRGRSEAESRPADRDMLTPVVDRLQDLHPNLIDLSLSRIARLLAALGEPQRRLPPVIHVAGTNGKGSTVAFMRSILEASGFSAHVYTSPHLVRFNERIRLGAPGGGHLVDDRSLLDALDRCERANGGQPITVFEITTAAALLLFSERRADVLLMETGLGGRLDATNVVDSPLVTVLTSISSDHTEHLGQDLASIAREKAGIVKPERPCILAPQRHAAVAEVVRDECRRKGAPLIEGGVDFDIEPRETGFVYRDANGSVTIETLGLTGLHQFDNAGTAVAALRQSGILRPGQRALADGLARAAWPGRLQPLGGGRIASLLPPDCDLWLDGAHNVDGARAAAAAMRALAMKDGRPLVLVLGMLGTKDATGFLETFAEQANLVLATPIESATASRSPAGLVKAAWSLGLTALATTSLSNALAEIRSLPFAVPPRVLITGSLYLAGEVLAFDGRTIG